MFVIKGRHDHGDKVNWWQGWCHRELAASAQRTLLVHWKLLIYDYSMGMWPHKIYCTLLSTIHSTFFGNLTIIEIKNMCVETYSYNGWCHRHQNRRLCSRPHSHELVIFFVFLAFIVFTLRQLCWIYEYACHTLRQPVWRSHCLLKTAGEWKIARLQLPRRAVFRIDFVFDTMWRGSQPCRKACLD